MRTILLCAAAVAFVVASCSPPSSQTTGEAGQETQTAATAPSSGPGAQLRQGRWSRTMTVMGQQTTDVECVTTSDLDQLAREPNSNCTSANGFQRTAEGMVYEAECTGEDGGGHIRTVMSGDLQNSYVVDSTMTAASGGPPIQIHIEARYEGACHGDE